jgi:hypothetical protein
LIVGSFLPWVEASGPFIGTIIRSGMDGGGDGIFFLAGGVVIGALAIGLQRAKNPTRTANVLGLLTFLAAILLVLEWSPTADRLSDVTDESLIVASEGTGLYVIGVGVIAGVVGWTLSREL